MRTRNSKIPSKQLQDEWSEMLSVCFQMICQVAETLMKTALKDQYESTLSDFDAKSAVDDFHFRQHAKMIQQMAEEDVKKKHQKQSSEGENVIVIDSQHVFAAIAEQYAMSPDEIKRIILDTKFVEHAHDLLKKHILARQSNETKIN